MHFSLIIVSSAILLSPIAYGNTLRHGPIGSPPAEKLFFLTLDRNGSGDARSYIVDHKGFYERDGWSRSDDGRIGLFNDDDGSRNNGSSSKLAFNGVNSKGPSSGVGGSFSGGAGFGGGSHSGGSGFFNMKGVGEAGGFAGGNKGPGFILSESGGPNSFGLGEGSKGLGDPRGVSATPLPASWTMMLIGLTFGLLVWLRKSTSATKKERPAVA
jgi:hypothetical protein